MNLRILNRKDIDQGKWNSCIDNSIMPLVYAKVWFLDIVSPEWNGLVADDYRLVMPLPTRDKWGVKYLYQPIFIQQLGVFSKEELSDGDLECILKSVVRKFRFVDISLNSSNLVHSHRLISRINRTFELNLNTSYEDLKVNYSKSNRKNIQKANSKGVEIEETKDIKLLVKMVRNLYQNKNIKAVNGNDYGNLEKIIKYSFKHEIGKLLLAHNNEEPLAVAFFLNYQNRVNIISATSSKGKETSAMFLLLDSFIKENAETNIILDFAGSNIKGIADRNKGFGSTEKSYVSIKSNNLPVPFRWLKS